MKICKKCGNEFPILNSINGKLKNFGSRKFCISCSPFGTHNTSNLTSPTPISTIDKLSSDEFIKLIKNATSRSDICDILKLRKSGASYKILNRRIKNDNLDTSHFNKGGSAGNNRQYTNDEIFRLCDRDMGQQPRIRIINDKLKEYKCEKCGVENMWNGEKICLHLDHVNGNRYDNQLKNLRFLCPNCHSQTPTYCGKDKKKKHLNKYFCETCKIQIKGYSKLCIQCARTITRKCKRPSKEILEQDVFKMPLELVGLKYDVTGNAIKKWCKSYNIKMFPKGYWVRRNSGYTHEESLISQKKLRVPQKRFTKDQISEIRNLINNDNISLREIGRKFNTSHVTISDIKYNRTYK